VKFVGKFVRNFSLFCCCKLSPECPIKAPLSCFSPHWGFQDENVHAVLQSLVEVITTTKMKAICNLAMWCISVQQFEGHLMSLHIHSIIRATVHALDNPMGSVSTTFEAFQAVVKLVDQMSNTMRDLSHIWCPPIYRRLISTDKRERDMAERCLRKIMLTFSSPLPLLSKIVATDIKQNLLLNMEKLLQNNGCKVYVIQAWGWFIRLLGENVIKSRSLVNQMLKIPQQTFADPDTQVRIATQVAWEALIDAFIQYPVQAMVDQTPTKKKLSPETVLRTASGANHQLQLHPPLKHLKLLMMPLVEVMSSKCDVSVRMSCWKTWNYLLHKLDSSVNNPAVVSIVLDPIFKVIFETGPDNKNLWIWDFCLNLLEEFVSVRVKHDELNIHVHREAISPKTPSHGISSKTNKDNFPYLPIKWLPWNLNQIELLLNYVEILWKCGFRGNQCSDFSSLTLNGALRIFRLILKGVKSDLNEELNPIKEHVQAIHFILHFVQGLCQDIALEASSECTKGPSFIIFNLLEIIKDELRPSILASFSFKMPLDVNVIWKIKGGRFSDCFGHKENIQTIGISLAKIDMVSPVVYLTLLWLNLVAHLCSGELEEEKLLERMGKITQIVSSGIDSLENFQVLASVLYAVGLHNFYGTMEIDQVNEWKDSESLPFKSGSFFWLRVWKVFTKCLRQHIEFVKDVTLFEVGTIEAGYQLIYSFLLFPIHVRVLYSFVNSNDRSSDHKYYKEYCNMNLEKEFDMVIQEWVMLYDSANLISSLKSDRMNFFAGGFCKKVLRVIDEEHDGHTSMEAPKDCDSGQLVFFRKSDYYLRLVGGLAAHVLKQVDTTTLGMPIINSSGQKGASNPSNVKSILTFIARFLEQAINADWNCVVVSRVFDAMACFLNHISTQDDILLFMQKLSNPLSKWLRACSIVDRIFKEGSPVFQLEKVWNQLLNCLHKSRPPLIFDSKFLSLQESLLVAAFEHIHSPIANRTIEFWEATYGKSSLLSYPESLVPVLSSLAQKVKITLPGFNISCSAQCENGNVLEPANELCPNISEKIDINSPCSGFANCSTANYRSGINKETSVGSTSFNVIVGSQNIKRCQRIQHSYSTGTGEVPSSSLQGVINSHEGENNVMNQNVNLFKGRKKLKFMDDSQDIDYVSIPSSVERKLHPLTDHQREVKRAQRGRGMDTMGHGPGIKTYTAADFSQGNGDSEEPEELNITDIILDKCRKKIKL
jgi:telomere-associated protein RIF1